MPGEFELIDRYFGLRNGAGAGSQVPLGIGDDCAALQLTPGHILLTSVDTFTEGVHFFAGTDPRAVGHKALAVNLSDLAACGARPLACLMAVSLPAALQETWLAGFAEGFLTLARQCDCPLIGGDTTRSGPGGGFSVSVTVMGEVPDASCILRRSGAHVGDDIWVSGRLGAAALGVALRSEPFEMSPSVSGPAGHALDWPQPRVVLGMALRGLASACIDVSDGFLADLGHVLKASGGLGATLDAANLPLSPILQHVPDMASRCKFALAGGDDYELCFTAAPCRRDTVMALGQSMGLDMVCVGSVRQTPGVVLGGDNTGGFQLPETAGYEHF